MIPSLKSFTKKETSQIIAIFLYNAAIYICIHITLFQLRFKVARNLSEIQQTKHKNKT